MGKVRISCDVNLNLRKSVDAISKEIGISRAQFIADAVQDKLEGANVHKENKRLTEAKNTAEKQVSALQQDKATLEKQVAIQKKVEECQCREKLELTEAKTEAEKQVSELRLQLTNSERGHRDTALCLEREKRERKDAVNRLEHENAELTEQRDKFQAKVKIAEKMKKEDEQRYQKRLGAMKKERDTAKNELESVSQRAVRAIEDKAQTNKAYNEARQEQQRLSRALGTTQAQYKESQAELQQVKEERNETVKQLQVASNKIVEDTNRVKSERDTAIDERDTAQKELAQVANRLGCRHTATHCRQRIDEIEQNLQTAKDKLGIVKSERDTAISEAKQVKTHADAVIKNNLETHERAERVITAYKTQGFWGRLFRRKPEPVEAEQTDGVTSEAEA